MDSAVIYEAFLSKVQADLLNYGYTRSGKSTLFCNPFAYERIGAVCRGRDYWWRITSDILKNCDPEEYYDRCIKNDIKACAIYLDELAEKKQMKYVQNGAFAD